MGFDGFLIYGFLLFLIIVGKFSPKYLFFSMDDFLISNGIRMFMDSRSVYIKKSKIYLRNKEFSLLEYFLRNVGRVLTRTQILEDVWDHNICSPTNTIDVHVSVLRRKLKKYLSYDPIKTIHSIGYMLEI
jgi:DNA-binding response OmpR family regulator